MSNPHTKRRISEMVEPQLNYYRKNCNFLEDELKFFNMSSRNKSLIQISLSMNISESSVCNLSRRVYKKIQLLDDLDKEGSQFS